VAGRHNTNHYLTRRWETLTTECYIIRYIIYLYAQCIYSNERYAILQPRTFKTRHLQRRKLCCIYLRSNPAAIELFAYDTTVVGIIIVVVAEARRLFVYVLFLIICIFYFQFFHTERAR